MQPPDQLDRDARTFLRLLAHDGVDSAWPLLLPEDNVDTIRSGLNDGREFLAPYGVDSAHLVGWSVVTMGDTRATLTYEVRGTPGSAVVTVQVWRRGPTSRITGFHWERLAAPLAELNAFTLHGRSLAHYAYLILAVLSVLACVGGAIFAGIRRLGVLWVMFCLVGVGKATINWTSGQQSFNPFTIQLVGAGYFRPGLVGPWLVSWSLPLGSILVLFKSRARRTPAPSPTPPVAA